MNFTIYDTPVVIHLIQGLAILLKKILRWKIIGEMPTLPKYVMIAAPHTSNWDLFYSFIFVFARRHKTYFMAKSALFKGPFGPLMKWAGGLPIDRSKANNIVASAVDQFAVNEKLVLTVPPEGTRSKSDYWKTGFYYIALNAGLPILLGFMDYSKKEMGYGPMFMPTGDIKKDMEKIREFYKDKRGKYPEMETAANIEIKKINKDVS